MSEDNLSLEQIEELQKDRYINALYSMWNSLIVLNGLSIGAVSILYLINANTNKFITLTIFSLSIVAIFFLIWNYHKIRTFYLEIGRLRKEDIANLSDEEYKATLESGNQKASRSRAWIVRREKVAVSLTFINLLLFLIIIAFNEFFVKI